MNYEQKIISAIDKALAGVVSIAASKDIKSVEEEMIKMGVDPRQFEDRLTAEAEEGRVSVASGSGFLVDKSGIVLTNKHVIQDKNATYKAVLGKNKYDIQIVGKDPLADIAILKMVYSPSEGELSTISLGSSKNLKLGETVIAIGNALGEFQNTVSTGIVSGLSRFLSAITDFEGHQERLRGLIQTDAAINPGNSGGPLINLEGEAIGINAAIVFGAQNIGFAIPIDRAKKDLEEIQTKGHIQTPFLGVRYVLINKALQKHFKLPIDHGALVVREGLPGDYAVLPGSAAEHAGISEHDIITTANGKDITEKETLEDRMADCSVGEKLELEVLRKGEKITVRVPLEDRARFI